MSHHPVIKTTAGKFTLEWFPPELQALREEIDFHPDLKLLLHNQEDKDVYIQICEIAGYCQVLLDGMYTRDNMIDLCGILIGKLQAKRTILIV